MVKIFLFVTNFVFVLCGIGMIVFGALTLTGYQKYLGVLEEPLGAYQAPPILAIAIGVIVFVIAFAGCCGAMRESNCLMMTYAIFLFVIMIAVVGLAVGIAVKQDDVEAFFKTEMTKSMKLYGQDTDEGKEATKTWDLIQRELHCCGVDSYWDWMKQFNRVPDSCCESGSCGLVPIPPQVYDRGCLRKVIEDIGIKYLIIGGGIFGGALLIAVILACCLAARFRRKIYHS
jgi:CD63 antigen